MRELNAPVPGDGGGVPFDDLMVHFIIGGDEACLMASATGVVNPLSDKSKIKHEIIMNDSRASMSVLRTAATGGATGPTYFLMEGVKTKPGYTSAWLQRQRRGRGLGHRHDTVGLHD